MASPYPVNVEINEKNLLKFIRVFRLAQGKIISEIEGATDFGVANRKALLAQIDNILEELQIEAEGIAQKQLPLYYEQGAKEAIRQLNYVGAEVGIASGFNRIHKQAILNLVDETAKGFAESITGVKRNTRNLLGKAVRKEITQKLAEGKISGDALRSIKREIIGVMKERGIISLIDKGGRKWELDRYTEMLIRTKSVEARNRGLVNRVIENGYDLVQVSDHMGECELCRPWEGKILSVTGKTKGYPALDQAESEGLFHPNCRHAINVLIPELAEKTKAYDYKTGKYA